MCNVTTNKVLEIDGKTGTEQSYVVTFCVVTFHVKDVVTLCVRKLLQFVLKKLLHFASEVVTFRVNVTFCVKSCYISR